MTLTLVGSSEDAAKMVAQAFVISRLDYCNAVYYGITDELTRCPFTRPTTVSWSPTTYQTTAFCRHSSTR